MSQLNENYSSPKWQGCVYTETVGGHSITEPPGCVYTHINPSGTLDHWATMVCLYT